MSFALTTDQFRARTKTVTRRRGWWCLKPGDFVMGCRKCQGLKPGEKIERLGVICVLETHRVPLDAITLVEVEHEGFYGMTPAEFVAMFCKHMKCEPSCMVTRIRFEYVDTEVS